MAAKRQSTTPRKARPEPQPRTVYTSPCGRLEIIRYRFDDFGIKLDSNFIGAKAYQHEAEYAGHDALIDAILEENYIQADQEAEADAARYAGYSWAVAL